MNVAWFAYGLPYTVIINTEQRIRTTAVAKVVLEVPFEHPTIAIERCHLLNSENLFLFESDLVNPVECVGIGFWNFDFGWARWTWI